MKIGILTLSASDNCGSLLQTYALQQELISDGCEIEVISFVNEAARKIYRVFHPGYIKNFRLFWGQIIKLKSILMQKQCYNKFREYINFSSVILNNEEELKRIEKNYDAIIVGSDQVWSVNMADFDDAYLLEWVKDIPKIAYAASLGEKNKKTEDYFLSNLKCLSSYMGISVREESSKELFMKLFPNLEVHVSVDPTLLIPRENWDNLTASEYVPDEDFIFYYSYRYSNEDKNNLVAKFAQRYNLSVYTINASRWIDGKDKRYGFKHIAIDGPIAFLTLMKHCKYSFVESFHGVIFSYIFYKNFWYVRGLDERKLDDRLSGILDLLDMSDRVMYTNKIWTNSFEINYTAPNKHLKEKVAESRDYLNSMLQCILQDRK